ncbi:MAG: hypothetical protein ACOX6T_01025 [Myxococcales bacterium]|jgi:hypothetical protein
MTLRDLTARLRASTERVDEGHIRIDGERALAKLRDHRLADPSHYVLELLRAAAASGARKVAVRADADDFELSFDGAPFPAAAMRDLLGHALGSDAGEDGVRLRLLALGTAGALALKPAWIRIRSGEVELELRQGGRAELRKLPTPVKGTELHVRERLGWRVLKKGLTGPAEAEVIARCARQFPARLTVNGERIDQGTITFDLPTLLQEEATFGPVRIVAAVPAAPLALSRLTLEVLGATVITRELELPLVQVVAWARDDQLQRNASGSDIAESDPRYEALLSGLRSLCVELLADLATGLARGPDERVRALLAEAALRAAADGAPPLDPRARQVLDSAPILPGPAGEWTSVAAFRAEAKAGRRLRFATRPLPAGSYTGPAILLAGSTPLARLLPGEPRLDVADEARALRRAQARLEAWARNPVEEAALPQRDDVVARAAFADDQVAGEVAFCAGGGAGELRLLCKGRFVQQARLELGALRPRAVLDLKQPLPERAWIQYPIELKARHARVLAETCARAILEALERSSPPPEALLAHARDLLPLILKRAPAPGLPAAMRDAKLFALAGDQRRVSLGELLEAPVCRYVLQPWPHPALDGRPVVVLREGEPALLARLLGRRRLVPCVEQLARELEIRVRLAGPREEPRVLARKAASAPIEASDIRGEVAVPAEPRPGLELLLLRDGFALETCALPPRFGPAVAAVECPSLKPADDDCRSAVRDEAFDAVVGAVRKGERRVVADLVKQSAGRTLDQLAPGPRDFLEAFLRHELAGARRLDEPDEIQRAVLEAPLLRTSSGILSLSQLSKAVGEGPLWVLEALPAQVAPQLTVVAASPELAALLSEILQVPARDARNELARIDIRRAFRALPEQALALPDEVRPQIPVDGVVLRGLLGLEEQRGQSARIDVLFEGRPLQSWTLPCALPLRGAVELTAPGFDVATAAVSAEGELRFELPHLEQDLVSLLAEGMKRLVSTALHDLSKPGARKALLHALGRRLDAELPPEISQRLLDARLFATTDGRSFSAADLDLLPNVSFVTEPLEGALASREPALLAVDPASLAALERWSARADVTRALEAELEARRRYEATAAVAEIALRGEALARRRVSRRAIAGEVALICGERRLELYRGSKPLCVVPEPALPPGTAAALNDDRLTPSPDFANVRRDKVLRRAVDVCCRELELLVLEIGEAWDSLGREEQARLKPSLAASVAWLWSRRKATPGLLELPLFEATDGRPLSCRDLLEQQRRRRVRWAPGAGALLDPDDWVWCPRPGERQLVAKTSIKLVNGADALRVAADLQARPKVITLTAPTATRWREPLASEKAEGEVALEPAAPSGKLVIHLHKRRIPLERIEQAHPVGGVAVVNCDSLTPNKGWNRAVRNQAFRDLFALLDEALERALVRLVREGQAEPGWKAYLTAAARWRLGQGGPLAAELPSLPLFEDLEGQPATLGQLLAEAARYGRVAVAEAGLRAPPSIEGIVLRRSPEALELLRSLGVGSDDLTEDLRRQAELEASRQARRLAGLQFPGDALLRLAVDAHGFSGELALPASPAEAGSGVVLARAGVASSGRPTDIRRPRRPRARRSGRFPLRRRGPGPGRRPRLRRPAGERGVDRGGADPRAAPCHLAADRRALLEARRDGGRARPAAPPRRGAVHAAVPGARRRALGAATSTAWAARAAASPPRSCSPPATGAGSTCGPSPGTSSARAPSPWWTERSARTSRRTSRCSRAPRCRRRGSRPCAGSSARSPSR